MAKRKKDRLNFFGFVSAIASNVARQRAMAQARDKPVKPPKVKKPPDTRTPEEIRAGVDATRVVLADTVGAITYDLDVPARARDLRDRVAARVPSEWKGEPKATIVALSVLVTGVGGILLGAIARLRRNR
jgi:Protein of unknown function (DUF3618)